MPQNRAHLASLVDDFTRNGDQIAITAKRGLRRERTTYRNLAELTRRFARELEQQGATKGDRVLIWGENSADWVAAFFGCVMRGVLPVPIDAAGTVEFARRVEDEVSPRLIAADAGRAKLLRSRAPVLHLEQLDHVLPREQGSIVENLRPQDPLQIVFTSGTTGDPKGIVHTHQNVLASLLPIELEMQKYLKYEKVFHPIRFLHTLPLSHVFGQFMGLWLPALMAAEVHFESRLVAGEVMEQIRQERISVLVTVPRLVDLLRRDLTGRFPALEQRIAASAGVPLWRRFWRFRAVHRTLGWKFWAFVCGGAALPEENERFWNVLGYAVIQGYGMTETTALISLNHPFHAARGSVGKVLPGREVRIAEDGEVLVRGETISNRVWQKGELRHLDSEWLATGDLAEIDEHGDLKFRGRKKDVIVTAAGLNIYPDDLEAALARQQGVRGAAIVEATGEQGPEAVAALVLGAGGSAEQAVASANRDLAEFQQIRRWVIWPEPDFPRTSTGKVLRREVARRLEAGEIAEAPGSELNLDSLGRVELQARLEQQYGVTLDDAALQQVRTDEDVRALVRGGEGHHVVEGQEHIYPRWIWNPAVQAVRAVFLELIAMPLLRFLAKPKVENHVQAWPENPVLIVANHVTSYDAVFLLYALPGRMRWRVAIAMSGEMILDLRKGRNQGNWFLNLVAPVGYVLMTVLFNVFPLPQRTGFRRSFAHAAEALERGYSVIVFPEGQRSDDGVALPFKKGAGLLWKELGTAALAMHLEGLGELKAEQARWFRSGRITVSALELLTPEPDATPAELTERLRRGVFPRTR